MDGLTQGLIGAAAASTVAGKSLGRGALAVGFVAGVLPDADFLIRFAADPLYTTVYHRGFSHALIFIPVGAAIAAAPFVLWNRFKDKQVLPWFVYLAALAGYATHGLLDACTTYGTRLWWPLSNQRVAWDLISVVDVFFTLPLLVGTVWSARTKRPRAARAAFVWALVYLGLCFLQHQRAASAQERLARSRGHQIEARILGPAPGAAILYRSVYRTPDGVMHADAIRAGVFSPVTVRVGSSLATFDPGDAQLWEDAKNPGAIARDLERYRWFTAGFWAAYGESGKVIGDMRIAADAASFEPLWGISIDPSSAVPVRPVSTRGEFDIGGFWREMIGADPRHRPIDEF